MAGRHSTGLAAYIADTGPIGTSFDAGGAPFSTLTYYTGAQPASADNAPTGTVLVQFTLPGDVFAAMNAQRHVALNTVTGVTAANSGTPGWFRFARGGDSGAASTTDRRLDGAFNAVTTLSVAAAAGDTTLTVADTTAFPAAGTLLVDNEQVTYTGKTATTFTGLTRGANATAAAAHTAGSVVKQVGNEMTPDTPTMTKGQTVNVGPWTYTLPQ